MCARTHDKMDVADEEMDTTCWGLNVTYSKIDIPLTEINKTWHNIYILMNWIKHVRELIRKCTELKNIKHKVK